MLTQKYLREILDYNHITGVFHWRRNHGTGKKGDIATRILANGTVSLMIDRVTRSANKIAWVHYYGKEPENKITKIDPYRGVEIDNLRSFERASRRLHMNRGGGENAYSTYYNRHSGRSCIILETGDHAVKVRPYHAAKCPNYVNSQDVLPPVNISPKEFYKFYKNNGFVTII